MACGPYLYKLLGQRYLCLLCGNAHRQAQNGACVKPEKIRGRAVWAAVVGPRFWAPVCSGDCKMEPCFRPYGLMYALICAVGALISMVGDLAASAIKRNKEIKDYGRLIPGHGGILDRFDSVIFTAPFIYFLANVLL